MAGGSSDSYTGITSAQLNTNIDNTIKIADASVVLDTTKTEGRKHRTLLKELVAYITERTQSLPVVNPNGVKWTTAPATPTITGTTINMGSSVVNVNGVNKTVAAQSLTFALATSGYVRLDAIVVNYGATPAVYQLISGTEVASTATAIRPPIPADRLHVSDVDVTDGAVVVSPPVGGAINTVNGQAPNSSKEVTVGAEHIDYAPADSDNTTGFFATLLTSGKLKISVALNAIVAAVKGKADKGLTINTQTASYTLALTDAAGMVRMNVGSANTLTVPPNSSVAFPVGTQIVISQAGAGQTTVVAGSGVTINSTNSMVKLAAQYAGGTLIKISTDTWTLFGNLTL